MLVILGKKLLFLSYRGVNWGLLEIKEARFKPKHMCLQSPILFTTPYWVYCWLKGISILMKYQRKTNSHIFLHLIIGKTFHKPPSSFVHFNLYAFSITRILLVLGSVGHIHIMAQHLVLYLWFLVQSVQCA